MNIAMVRKMTADNPTLKISAVQFAAMRPMNDVTPSMVAAIKAARGRPRVENPKVVVSVRLSAPGKRAWDRLSTKERTKLITAMERAALRAAE